MTTTAYFAGLVCLIWLAVGMYGGFSIWTVIGLALAATAIACAIVRKGERWP